MATGMAIMGFGGGALIGAPLGVKLMEHFKTETSMGVAETFVALMDLDPASVLHAPVDWRPGYGSDGLFGMVDLVRTAGLG